MNFSSLTSDSILILLLSLQRICRNLSNILNTLEVDVNSFRRLLIEVSSSIPESLSSSNIEDETEEENNYYYYYEFEQKKEDFYEELFDEQLEPKPLRITTL
ncbi:unnamed protein product [Rotaria sp. Silwood1]|nr:unnamed protein product [Rotaria sp. Silwood1]CAF1212554.1 unnamed protein product [Rotaria sp. Silwood1]CAF3465107.1 unnamed protein product [Rotaria sp. Silwood1]CAF3508169.1 unnamed protein product [Rotaria sp. Silwood1]CAF4769668.1 unnamed protein product [Rotaria sp. Silwood1]